MHRPTQVAIQDDVLAPLSSVFKDFSFELASYPAFQVLPA